MLSDFVAEVESIGPIASTSQPAKKKLRRTKTPLVEFALPFKPAGGEEYSKKEVCKIVSSYRERSAERGAAVRAIEAHNGKYVEGCSKVTINRLVASHPKRQGVYGYYDVNRGCFVRSGKVTRRGFDDRGSEHEKGAKAVTASSHFYDV
ncbi:hypothetical protein THAOC_24957, partial [Thalassiosira oceanica]